MFREMRRKKQQLPQEICADILYQGASGVLALYGDGGYPYAVPISYVYDGEKVYFHCAKYGHKLDAIKREPKASFCVIDQDQIIPEEYTTYFRSVIVFGTMRIINDEAQKRSAIEKLAVKYAPEDRADRRRQAIDREWTPLCMLEMTVDHITGKQAIELVNERKQEKIIE